MEVWSTVCRRALLLPVLALLCTLLASLGAAPLALASPPDPWMTVSALQSALDEAPGGVLHGHFDTVLMGASVVPIPVTITSIVPNSIPEGSLIFFQASGDDIEQIGGIAHGMSGSPLYVNVGGTDYLAGAVSYGDVFTKDYLGMATPVEYMDSMRQLYMPTVKQATLPVAVRAAGKTVSRVLVAPSQRVARTLQAGAGSVVMEPLASVGIAGLPPQSAAYKDLAARLAQRGYDVAPYGAQVSGWDPSFSAPLVGGASVGVMLTRGNVVVGALATVTYADGGAVLMFGHPLDAIGDVSYYMTNAWVEGVWSSNYDPYKLMDPAALRGSIVQDRNVGVAGVIDTTPPETSVSGSATSNPAGKTSSVDVHMPTWVIDQDGGDYGGEIVADVLSAAGYQATDTSAGGGFATTTTTVAVSDKDGHSYTLSRVNLWDDREDVVYASVSDVYDMVDELTNDPDGANPATITSVSLTSTVNTGNASARIASVTLPSGLKRGSNEVTVSLYAYGQDTPITVSGHLELPAGTTTQGTLEVYAATNGDDSTTESASRAASRPTAAHQATNDRPTVAQRVAAAEAEPTNDQLIVSYTPDSDGAIDPVPLTTTMTVPNHYLSGSLQRRVGHMRLSVSSKQVPYRGSFLLRGAIAETGGKTSVDLYRKPYGATHAVKFATVTAVPDGLDGASFAKQVAGLTKNTLVYARWAGDDVALGATASVGVQVRQRVSLQVTKTTSGGGAPIKLLVTVRPGTDGQPVWFERKMSGTRTWVRFKVVRLNAARQATCGCAPSSSACALRVHVPATATNAAASSKTITIPATER
jgi:hypothetical protein